MARYDPHRTARRNCQRCWKPVVPGTLGCVTENVAGRNYHFHSQCHAQTQAEQANPVCGWCTYQGRHELCLAKDADSRMTCACGC